MRGSRKTIRLRPPESPITVGPRLPNPTMSPGNRSFAGGLARQFKGCVARWRHNRIKTHVRPPHAGAIRLKRRSTAIPTQFSKGARYQKWGFLRLSRMHVRWSPHRSWRPGLPRIEIFQRVDYTSQPVAGPLAQESLYPRWLAPRLPLCTASSLPRRPGRHRELPEPRLPWG